jgi:hypothetical protein
MRRLIPGVAAMCFALLMAALLLHGQRRDFLSEDEADQIREAQDPNMRLALYVKFARLRLELVKQTLAVEKPGRSTLIHDSLEDYSRIIEAIDNVIDDALVRKVDVSKGVALVAEQEKEFLATLQGFAAAEAKDRYLFEYVLTDALEITQDSLEESEHDLEDRARQVLEQDLEERKKRESMMTPAEVERRREAEEKEEKTKKKAPTLRRKGESPGTTQK